MILITKVERKGKKIQLTLSDSTSLKLSSDIFKKYNFVSGEEVDDQLLEKIKYENEYYEAKISALRFLSIRNHSLNELKQKLIKKKYSLNVIQRVLDELINLNYLNDKKFADQFYNELLNKGFGPLKIKNEMIKRGIEIKAIDEILQDYFNNDEEQIKVILKYLQKNKFSKKLKTKKEFQKVYNHLAGRGFSSSAILKSLKEKFGNKIQFDAVE